jgi:hypothetical protein
MDLSTSRDRMLPAALAEPTEIASHHHRGHIVMKHFILPASLLIATLPVAAAQAQTAAAIAAPGEILVATIHAQGIQLYDCKGDASGKLTWQFREPVATLIEDGKTVGRHFAGPHWELSDGSIIAAKVSGRAPGATASDIPLLKLDVTTRRSAGRLADITTIQRINTKGGVAEGACSTAGAFLSVPYSADYAFYRKPAATGATQ